MSSSSRGSHAEEHRGPTTNAHRRCRSTARAARRAGRSMGDRTGIGLTSFECHPASPSSCMRSATQLGATTTSRSHSGTSATTSAKIGRSLLNQRPKTATHADQIRTAGRGRGVRNAQPSRLQLVRCEPSPSPPSPFEIAKGSDGEQRPRAAAVARLSDSYTELAKDKNGQAASLTSSFSARREDRQDDSRITGERTVARVAFISGRRAHEASARSQQES